MKDTIIDKLNNIIAEKEQQINTLSRALIIVMNDTSISEETKIKIDKVINELKYIIDAEGVKNKRLEEMKQ